MEDFRRFRLESGDGDAEFIVHRVFEGIELTFNAVHMPACALGASHPSHCIEIHHCREGRLEQQLDDTFFYLSEGDLSVSIRHNKGISYKFPLKHYHGVTISIDTDIAPACFSCFLKDVEVSPMAVAKKLCGENKSYVARSAPFVEHIFSELYTVPEKIQKGYFKVKVLELLLMLSGIQAEIKPEDKAALPPEQARLAAAVGTVIAEELHHRISLEQLTKRFGVSSVGLQNAFKGVYGMPIISYVRLCKMQRAALDLIQTERSVLEIAGELGYDNASKFADAFKKLMGETPSEYRKNHSKI